MCRTARFKSLRLKCADRLLSLGATQRPEDSICEMVLGEAENIR